jgi:hypothetical protein
VTVASPSQTHRLAYPHIHTTCARTCGGATAALCTDRLRDNRCRDLCGASDLLVRSHTPGVRAHARTHARTHACSYAALQSWGILACIGIITGLLAAAVDIGVAWFADIKLGYCSHAFWIPRYKCCIASRNYFSCAEWRLWSEYLGFERGSALGGIADFLVFVGAAVLFATVAAYLVASWSLLAAGDGIPEAKTFAGGFGIPGHLSKTTLVTKACAVVLAVSRSAPRCCCYPLPRRLLDVAAI